MSSRINRVAGAFGMAALMAAGSSYAVDLNEVGAFLVYSVVTAEPGKETFLTVTNTGSDAINAHISVIEGVGTASSPECAEYNRIQKLTGFDTETFVLYPHANGIRLDSLDSDFSFAVPVQNGFVTINAEEFNFHNSTPVKLTANVLMGSEVVVDYVNGTAYSIDAIPFQGFAKKLPPPGYTGGYERTYHFDGREYMKFPRRVAVEFIAPDGPGSSQFATPVTAELALFTLNFEHKFPPMSVCSISAFDARENFISGSLMFGCWGLFDLADQPELAYPELGDAGEPDVHGWLTLNCKVDGSKVFEGEEFDNGAVHGAIIQSAAAGAGIQERDGSGPTLSGSASWSRLLWQSTGEGDSIKLKLENFSDFNPTPTEP